MDTHFTRRRFLRRALATTAACGLARLTAAAEARPPTPPDLIIDTHVYLGHWPHKQLPGDEATDILAILRTNHVAQAWTGSFDGLFHKDIGAVNQRLAQTCAQYGNGLLIPIGTVNPTLPDWEDDLRRCHEIFHIPGIRLHPNYHGYSLDDPRFARLLELAAGRGLIVQLVAWLDDDRHKWFTPNAAQVDLRPLSKALARLPNMKLVVANGFRNVDDEAFQSLVPIGQVYFDFARLENPTPLELEWKHSEPAGLSRQDKPGGSQSRELNSRLSKLVVQVTAGRVLFGSSRAATSLGSGTIENA